MKKALLLVIAAIGLSGCSSTQASAPATAPPKAWTVTDIKGDVLGMSHDAYSRAHPGDCPTVLKGSMCYGTSTYADLRAGKVADFFHGKLLSITYNVVHTFNDKTLKKDDSELLAAVEARFGGASSNGPSVKQWDNGTVTIMLIDQPGENDPTSLSFTLDSLQQEQLAEWDKEKAARQAAAKKDM